MLVSIIMPTYNQADFIGDAIFSALSQNYKNFELIIVDNFSTDETERVVLEFNDPRVRYFKFNNCGVIAAGRNFGVKQSIGEVLAFLDSDDIWEPTMLSAQMAALQDDACLVSSCFKPIGNVTRCRNHLDHIPENTLRRFSFSDLIQSNSIMTSSVVILKKTFVDAGGFDESSDFRFIEDWELWLRIAKHKDFIINGQRLLNYRISAKKDRDLRDVKLRTLLIMQKNFESGFVDSKFFRTLKANCYVDIGKAFLDMNDRSGIRYYLGSLLYSTGFKNRVRAILGLGLFLIPFKLRVKLVDSLYLLQFNLSKTK